MRQSSVVFGVLAVALMVAVSLFFVTLRSLHGLHDTGRVDVPVVDLTDASSMASSITTLSRQLDRIIKNERDWLAASETLEASTLQRLNNITFHLSRVRKLDISDGDEGDEGGDGVEGRKTVHIQVEGPDTGPKRSMTVTAESVEDLRTQIGAREADVVVVWDQEKRKNYGVRSLRQVANGSSVRIVDPTLKDCHVVNGHKILEHRDMDISCTDPESLGEETQDVTIVTGVLNIGRKEHRGRMINFVEDYLKGVLDTMRLYGGPMVILLQEEYVSEVQPHLKKDMMIVTIDLNDLRRHPNYNEIQDIRMDDTWRNQAGWLRESPQANLELYNTLVMSKVNWLRDIARANPFNTHYFLWHDAAHPCRGWINRSHFCLFKMLSQDKFLITRFPYKPEREIHGFEYQAMRRYVGGQHLPFVTKGGVMGGPASHIATIAGIYNFWMNKTLSEGYMGTEESIFTILAARYPEFLYAFDTDYGGAEHICWFFDRSKNYPFDKSCKPLPEAKNFVLSGVNKPDG